MDAPPSPTPPLGPLPELPAVLAAWPRAAQLASAFLLGLTTALLAVQGWRYSRWGTRPTEMQHDALPVYRINLNRADRAELLQLPGIGEKLAGQIEDYRRNQGSFRSVEELALVNGLGPARLDRLRPWVYVDDQDEQQPSEPPREPVRLSRASRNGETSPSPKVPGARKVAALKGPININRADGSELQRLPGIGPKLSQRIVDERRRGPFRSVDDLRRVPGIGPKTLERLRPHITVDNDSERVATTD